VRVDRSGMMMEVQVLGCKLMKNEMRYCKDISVEECCRVCRGKSLKDPDLQRANFLIQEILPPPNWHRHTRANMTGSDQMNIDWHWQSSNLSTNVIAARQAPREMPGKEVH